MARDNLVAADQDGYIVTKFPFKVRPNGDVNLVQHDRIPSIYLRDDRLHSLAEVAPVRVSSVNAVMLG